MAQSVSKTLYKRIQRFELSEPDLRHFNFPRQHTQLGKAKIFNIQGSFYEQVPGRNLRNCRRCKKVYRIHDNGRPVVLEKCVHHWGTLFRTRNPYYYCCKKPRNARPCASAAQHVTQDLDFDNLTGFINTTLNKRPSTESIYALDCEMLFTTDGMDVAAISIVDSDCKLVYETLVMPDAPIIDYHTNFSGLVEGQFRGVRTRLSDVHAKLLSLVGSRTILVGHGLDNDLLKLKVIHDHVVDTSVLYPHPKGLPARRSLLSLKDEFLVGTIGHSTFKCRGDAEAAMKLVLRKC